VAAIDLHFAALARVASGNLCRTVWRRFFLRQHATPVLTNRGRPTKKSRLPPLGRHDQASEERSVARAAHAAPRPTRHQLAAPACSPSGLSSGVAGARRP